MIHHFLQIQYKRQIAPFKPKQPTQNSDLLQNRSGYSNKLYPPGSVTLFDPDSAFNIFSGFEKVLKKYRLKYL